MPAVETIDNSSPTGRDKNMSPFFAEWQSF